MKEEFYNYDKNCSNCKGTNFLKVKKGVTVKEFIKEQNILCSKCGCPLIEEKVKA